MKKTKINLLTNREDYQKIDKYFKIFRSMLLLFSILFFIAVILFYLSNTGQISELDSLIKEKKSLMNLVTQNKVYEMKMNFIDKKYSALKEFSKDDALFLPYYNFLSSLVTTSSESGSITNFSINKNREIDFMIAFGNFTQIIDFFKFLESEKFLSNFESLYLKGFNIMGNQLNTRKSYDLSFSGKFKDISKNENKN